MNSCNRGCLKTICLQHLDFYFVRSISLTIAHLGQLEKSESWKFVSEKGYEPWTDCSPIQSNNTSDYQNKEV